MNDTSVKCNEPAQAGALDVRSGQLQRIQGRQIWQ